MSQAKRLASLAPQLLSAGVGIGGFVFGTSYLLNNSIYHVEAGHRAVKFNRLNGIQDTVYREGTHFSIPWLERPLIFDIRSRPRAIAAFTGSHDLQMVNVTIRVLCHPDSTKLPEIYRRLGLDREMIDEKILPSIVNEVVKSVVANYNASQLITQRELVSASITEKLLKRSSDFHIILDDVSITHLSFSSEYEKAVEAKQVAQQETERAKYVVDKARETKKATIIKAEGEEKAAQLIGTALQGNEEFVELRKLDAAREVALAVAQSSNKLVLPSSTLMLVKSNPN